MPDSFPPSPALLDADAARALVEKTYPQPSAVVVAKDIGHIDTHLKRFIETAPFYCMATADAAGNQDVTPRGDPPGTFKVLGPNTLALPDRPGNNRLDALRNLVENPHIGLLFVIPGVEETVRINGNARLSVDPDLLASMAVEGNLPRSAIVVEVTEAFLHCAKAFKRSKLWDPSAQVPRTALPSLGTMLADHVKMTPEQKQHADERIELSYRTLWAAMKPDTTKIEPKKP
ncbi:MAG: pyridoxamine 5'-phosphate oxidase family protein [Alphaproteobacteria bacterium]|nr:pyridoxamine 5'-phosphate oxidase family protein [Alphaproteobacteria bacterium]